MQVRLRQRNQGKRTSLYLDTYYQGSRKLVYLQLYLEPKPKNAIQKQLNKEILQLAESIRAKRQIAFQNDNYGFHTTTKTNQRPVLFLE